MSVHLLGRRNLKHGRKELSKETESGKRKKWKFQNETTTQRRDTEEGSSRENQGGDWILGAGDKFEIKINRFRHIQRKSQQI